MIKLSKREAEVLEFIKAYQKENGFSPSHAEIKKAIFYNSNYGLCMAIDSLADKGYIMHRAKVPRAIGIVPVMA